MDKIPAGKIAAKKDSSGKIDTALAASGKIAAENIPAGEIEFRGEPHARDISGIRRLLETTDVFYPHEIDVAVELVEDRILKGRASEYYFVFAQNRADTLGYVCHGPITMTEGRFDLYWIAVRKDAQGMGLGGKLLLRAEEDILERGGRIIYVETSSRDVYLPTRKFYLAHGYIEVARVPRFYGDEDDKLIFMKDI
jgi:ribosomal protein S18 acetylase RimI-like enzyme